MEMLDTGEAADVKKVNSASCAKRLNLQGDVAQLVRALPSISSAKASPSLQTS
jgi:hypothetical protein